ncbi:MAG: UDP-N-acetylglucosamine 2-epimerase, partial [Bdellovibrionota bacterium]
MKKILFISGSRADFGLLRKLIMLFQSDSNFETHLAATGSHLSKTHGSTVDLIRNDGIKNIHEVPMDINGDSPFEVNNSMARELTGFNSLFQSMNPNLIVVLGDRYELWPPCIAAALYNIPIAHIHGGESTEGAIDEVVRHSITKMAHIHFSSHSLYRERIIRMGESPARVHNVGAMGLDRLKEMTFLTKSELEGKIRTK